MTWRAETAPFSFVPAMPTFESQKFHERESRFISGVYNYCDRWCEQCRFNDRCRVYDQERAMKERHEILGDDPDDPEVVMQDVGANLAEAMGMLQQMADEMGIDFDAAADEDDEEEEEVEVLDEPFTRPRHPLVQRANAWMDRVEPFLDTIREEIPTLGEEMASSLFREDDERQVEARGHEIVQDL